MKQIMSILEYKDLINEDENNENKIVIEYDFNDINTSESSNSNQIPTLGISDHAVLQFNVILY